MEGKGKDIDVSKSHMQALMITVNPLLYGDIPLSMLLTFGPEFNGKTSVIEIELATVNKDILTVELKQVESILSWKTLSPFLKWDLHRLPTFVMDRAVIAMGALIVSDRPFTVIKGPVSQ